MQPNHLRHSDPVRVCAQGRLVSFWRPARGRAKGSLLYNDAVTALLKGRELNAIRRREEPNIDYEAWEARVQAEEAAQAAD